MIKTTPPKRCRRRRHKHHRIRTGKHASVAIGSYDLGMQGGVVEQLRQIRSQTSLARILVRFNDARQRMRIDGARQAAVGCRSASFCPAAAMEIPVSDALHRL